jgi:ribulose-5-phosphate 4-epimerase/fuculose-1-phosphate aldolase
MVSHSRRSLTTSTKSERISGRLAAAFRIFGQNGFDEGVAGHITLRVG